MITRRRGRRMSSGEEPSLKVETVATSESATDASQTLTAITAGMDFAELFEFEDVDWSERDAAVFDMALDGLGAAGVMDGDSGMDVSVGAPDGMFWPDLQTEHGRNPAGHVSNKNAIAARLNRLKKKEYVNNLEKKVSVLSAENGTLKQENCQLTSRVEELEGETRYLRAVLANQSVLAQLLSRLSGMKLSSSLFQNANPNDHDYALPRKRVKVKEKETSGGVCLHVDQNHVSVEFCRECAESASTSLRVFF
ncbi:CREB/ATF bZIP transcription factor [Takifugu rubripes]|nr:CREB/ATF bZIP transcription factor [Takifugu rubripes]